MSVIKLPEVGGTRLSFPVNVWMSAEERETAHILIKNKTNLPLANSVLNSGRNLVSSI